MGKLITLSLPSHFDLLTDGLWRHYLSNFATDFEICVKNDDSTASVEAHRLILSLFCPTLSNFSGKKLILDNDMNIKKKDIQLLMEFVYRGSVKVNESRLRHLKEGATALGLAFVVQLIDDVHAGKVNKRLNNDKPNDLLPSKRKRRLTEAGLELIQTWSRKRRKEKDKTAALKCKGGAMKLRSSKLTKRQANRADETKQVTKNSNLKSKRGRKAKTVVELPDDEINGNSALNESSEEALKKSKTIEESDEIESKKRYDVRRKSPRKKATKQPHKSDRKTLKKTSNEKDQSKDCSSKSAKSNEEGGKNMAAVDVSEPKADGESKEAVDEDPRNVWLKEKVIQLTNHKVYDWTCDICGEYLVGWYRQVSHLKCHLYPDKICKCPHCQFVCEANIDMTRHLVAKHGLTSTGEPMEKNVKCPHCPFTCVTKSQLVEHRIYKHMNRHMCDECSELFTTQSKLVYHKLVKHCKMTQFACRVCGYETNVSADFKKHVKGHEKKETCDVCGDDVPISDVRSHQLKHAAENDDNLKCHLCSFSTQTPYCFKFHLRLLHRLPLQDVAEIMTRLQSEDD